MNNEINYVSPFKRFCITIGNLPTAYIESMSYYEGLTYLVNYLSNNVIPALNNNGEVVEEVQKQFTILKNYVDTYFEDLDVQEEVNIKLDEMAQSGELTDIIAQYLGLAGMFTYDNVSEMKLAENLTNGSKCTTLGFYSVNDGGGATYKIRTITSDDVVDDKTIISLYNNTLIAELIKTEIMNIKQFGALGNGTTDDTLVFDTALNYNKIIYVNDTPTSYKVSHLVIPEGCSLIGETNEKVQIDIEKGTDIIVSKAESNTELKNIKLNSIDENLAWNRFDLNSKTNVLIDNCEFTGFRDTDTVNAWGILLTGSELITIKNSYFSNNSQSDIAIVEGCKNIIIDSCSGSSLHINIEPESIPYIDCIEIKNSQIAKLDIRENNYQYNIIRNVIVSNCIIDLFEYDGGTTTLIDCIIKAYQPQTNTSIHYSGNLKFINSGNFSDNMLTDPYINNFTASTSFNTPWGEHYLPVGLSLALNYTKIGDENVLEINPNNTNTGILIKHKPILINENKIYLLKLRGGAYYATGSNNISRILRIEWLDNDDVILQTQEPSSLRGVDNSVVPIHDEMLILKPYTGATKLQILIRNSSYGVQSVRIASVELFEINSNETFTNNLNELPINRKRVFTGSTADSAINYAAGDIMYYESPTTHIGKVRTVGGYSGTWKDFGEISA